MQTDKGMWQLPGGAVRKPDRIFKRGLLVLARVPLQGKELLGAGGSECDVSGVVCAFCAPAGGGSVNPGEPGSCEKPAGLSLTVRGGCQPAKCLSKPGLGSLFPPNRT